MTEQIELITCKRCASIALGGVNGGRKGSGLITELFRVSLYPDDHEILSKAESKSGLIREALHEYLKKQRKPKNIMSKIVIAVTSNSGGSGKTTTVRNLGYEFSKSGKNVLLIDLDPQANLDLFCGTVGNKDTNGNVSKIFEEGFSGEWPISSIDGEDLKLVRGSSAMSVVQIGLSTRRGREWILSKALNSLDEFDIVLLDCPATSGLIIDNALAAATHVLIPVLPEEKSIHGLGDILAGLVKLSADLNIVSPQLLGVCLSSRDNVNTSTAKYCKEDLGEISKILDFKILPGIGEYEDIRRACAVGLPLRRFRPGHRGVREYGQLSTDILEILYKTSK